MFHEPVTSRTMGEKVSIISVKNYKFHCRALKEAPMAMCTQDPFNFKIMVEKVCTSSS
jgi:hypothetical protein